MNDVGSWALVSFQATFYSRVYDLGPDVYAPALAAVLPIGGIIGGVTGGLAGDWLSKRGGRQWLTAGPLLLHPIRRWHYVSLMTSVKTRLAHFGTCMVLVQLGTYRQYHSVTLCLPAQGDSLTRVCLATRVQVLQRPMFDSH